MIDPPEITRNILDQLADEDYERFASPVRQFYRYVCFRAGYEPTINENRLENAWQCYRRDKKHGAASLPGDSASPNHFKLCGVLAFWLRRFAPVYDLRDLSSRRDTPPILIDIMKNYNSEFLAFEFGLKICLCFEKNREDRAPRIPQIAENNFEYYREVCYMMKFKNTSPHSMGLIYRSLFVPVTTE